MPSSNSALAACINPVSPAMGPRRWQEVKVRRHVLIGILKGILVIGIKNAGDTTSSRSGPELPFWKQLEIGKLQVDILTAEQGLQQQELFTEWETVMRHYGYLIVGKEDLNSPKVTEMQNKGVFKSQTSLVPAKSNRVKIGRKGKQNLGKFLSFLAARTQQGMTLLNGLLLLIIFLIFPSW